MDGLGVGRGRGGGGGGESLVSDLDNCSSRRRRQEVKEESGTGQHSCLYSPVVSTGEIGWYGP